MIDEYQTPPIQDSVEFSLDVTKGYAAMVERGIVILLEATLL